ncbi:hypothetical protein TDB9533_04677 [Thalassocella blandensis]|nr:hypothetical protein TDB9533_04677 [Thalassocella blandensis]
MTCLVFDINTREKILGLACGQKRGKVVRSILLLASVVAGIFTSTNLVMANSSLNTTPSAKQEILRSETRQTVTGTDALFTGQVLVERLFPANNTARFSGAYVTFSPGARSAWHIHPAGQHIVVTSGQGRLGEWSGEVKEIKQGDVVWCPPGIKHWHGAGPESAMTHLVITGDKNGANVEWKEKVSNTQYNGER